MNTLFLILTIYMLLPISVGIFSNQYGYLKNRYKKSFRLMLRNDKYTLFQAGASHIILTCFFALFIAFLVLDKPVSTLPFGTRLIVYALLLLGTVLSIFVVYKDIEKTAIIIYKNWLGKLAIIAIITVSNAYSSSFTNRTVEELTGFSSSNFHSIDELQWLFFLVFITLAFTICTLFIGVFIFIKNSMTSSNEKSALKKHLFNNIILTGHMVAVLFIYISSYIALNKYVFNLSNLFTDTFVEFNYRGSNIDCMKDYKPDNENVDIIKVAYIWRNTINDSNLSLVIKTDDSWEFTSFHCLDNKKMNKNKSAMKKPAK